MLYTGSQWTGRWMDETMGVISLQKVGGDDSRILRDATKKSLYLAIFCPISALTYNI